MRNTFFEDKIMNLVKEHLTDEITRCRIRNLSIGEIAIILRDKYGARVDIESGITNYTTTLSITLDIFHSAIRFGYMVASAELDRSGLAVPLNAYPKPNYYDRVEYVKLPEELFQID